MCGRAWISQVRSLKCLDVLDILGGFLACMDVPGILGEFAQVCRRLGYAGRVGSNTWRALGISGAHLAAKLILKRGEINLKSNEF